LEFSFINIFLEGTALGFSLAFLFGFGPAFFALIQTGIHRGFVPAVLLAVGILLNDAAIISLTVFGATEILSEVEKYEIIGIIGGVIIIVFGIVSYRRSGEFKSNGDEMVLSQPKYIVYISKGFLLNLVNPFVWMFWLGIVVGITARFSANATNVFIFFAGTLSIVFLTDILKGFMAARLKKHLTDKFLIVINKIAGIALVGFGIFLIIKSFLAI
jgi:threonine/homoserine/homoserine lactone efflux protein